MDGRTAHFLMYRAANDEVVVNALVKDNSIWLNQKAMAELFDVSTSSISRHLKNIFSEGELDEKVVVAEIATTTQTVKEARLRACNLASYTIKRQKKASATTYGSRISSNSSQQI